MKLLLVLLLIISACLISAAQGSDPGLRSLVQAEKAFMQMAQTRNTRDAFLYFLTDDAITASPGQGPRKGKQHLKERAPDDSWLSWTPAFSDLAASGDFGYNTGPWEFRQKRTDEEPVAFGQFVSLWKKDERGEWKVALDVGISHKKPTGTYAWSASTIDPETYGSTPSDRSVIFGVEREFIKSITQRGEHAYPGRLSEEVRLFRSGQEPRTGRENALEFLKESKQKVTYRLVGGDIAPSGDMACLYGEATVERRQNGTPEISKHTYVRFWKKEDGDWRIVVDLLSD
ncbi:MAG TPA: nuclear transport factor 2 family protein [Chryseosolibacter sp.]|nr:nuclear transport factor 2 family protein [Chryseosolibacter sp.]